MEKDIQMKHKKHKFFLADVPLMLVVAVLSVILANNYSGKATMVGYQVKTQQLGEYTGEVIRDGGTTGVENQQEEDFYNGSDVRDNGMPYCIKVNKTQNVVTIYKVGNDCLLYTSPSPRD